MKTSFLLTQPAPDPLAAENFVETHLSQPAAVDRKPAVRSKIWQLKEANRCPIIGTCLSTDELIQFARRYRFEASLADTFLLHVEMVDHMATRNSISETIQKHLDTRYQLFIARFEQAKTDADVLALWKECFANGEIAGAVWASLTHKRVSDETRGKVYGDVHMHAHQRGAGQAADSRRLIQLQKEHAEIKTVMAQQKQKHERTEAKLRQRLQESLAETQNLRRIEKDSTQLQVRLSKMESGKAMIEMGARLMKLTTANEQLQVVAKRVNTLQDSLEAAERKIQAMTRERDDLLAERNTLETLLLAGNCRDACDAPLPSTSAMQDRCVLCVGGRVAQLPHYRLLAEKLGVRLLHHDGGQQDALSRLPEMINSADAAICPTDCVGHAAYYQLKRLCKRSGKPCLLFKGKGVSSFATALTRLSSGQVSLNGEAIESTEIIM